VVRAGPRRATDHRTESETSKSRIERAPARRNSRRIWRPADDSDGRDFDAHGEFDDQALPRSPQLWFSQHHGLLAAAGATTADALVFHRRQR
jgi:hypothetical protein